MKNLILVMLFLMSSITLAADINTEAVQEHNYWRDQLNNGLLPDQEIPNPFLQDVVYDPTMQSWADASAARCQVSHESSSARNGHGENVYASTNGSVAQAVKVWVDEYKVYNYGDLWSGSTGHYTQVMAYRSTKIACASNQCDVKDGSGNSLFYGLVVVCQYSPAGNIYGQNPYSISGNKTSAYYNNTNKNALLQNIEYNNKAYRAKLLWDGQELMVKALQETPSPDYSFDIIMFDGATMNIREVLFDNGSILNNVILKYKAQLTFTF